MIRFCVKRCTLMLLAAVLFILASSSTVTLANSDTTALITNRANIQNKGQFEATQKTSQYFNTIKHDPQQLMIFLNKMPKGADLHMHIDGAVYAENLLNYGIGEGFCIDPKTFAVSKSEDCPKKYQLKSVLLNYNLYNQTIDAWSMRNFPSSQKTGEKHFFAAFPKFIPLVYTHLDKVVAGIINRAAQGHEDYIELMLDSKELHILAHEGVTSAQVGKRVGWNPNLAKLRRKLLDAGLAPITQLIAKRISKLDGQVRKDLHCSSSNAQPGCKIRFAYQYIAMRNLPPAQFFAELVTAFDVAKHDPKVAGINIVMQENDYTALKDYDLQMRMIGFLHKVYPKVNISLHAGELSPKMVEPKALTHHIRDAINIAHAQRIGHGVDIAYEHDAKQLLRQMADKRILVETNLTSNADVLGLTGNQEPIMLYLRYHVPVALSTDDEGIERTDLTREYQRAVLTYHLSYPTIKGFARDSISYSFLPGKNLWRNPEKYTLVTACRKDKLGAEHPSKACADFLAHSEKAQVQWQLEAQFNKFERQFEAR